MIKEEEAQAPHDVLHHVKALLVLIGFFNRSLSYFRPREILLLLSHNIFHTFLFYLFYNYFSKIKSPP